jgi:hypothetical protein
MSTPTPSDRETILREQLAEDAAIAAAAFDDDGRGPAWAYGYLAAAVRDYLSGRTRRTQEPHANPE